MVWIFATNGQLETIQTGMGKQSSTKERERKAKRNVGHDGQKDLEKEGKGLYKAFQWVQHYHL